MKKFLDIVSHPFLLLIYRLVIGLTFIYASYYKIVDPQDFARSIYNYRIMPVFFINVLAITLPWLELVCGLLLVIGLFRRPMALILAMMLLVFSIAVSSVMIRGIDVDCGCFRKAPPAVEKADAAKTVRSNNSFFSHQAGWGLLTRDIIMFMMAILLTAAKRNVLEADYFLRPRRAYPQLT